MRRFEFRLESVLRFKQQRQRLAEAHVRQLAGELQAARDVAGALRGRLGESAAALETGLRAGQDMALWLARRAQSARLGEAVEAADAAAEAAARRAAEAATELRRAAAEVESLLLLRERHLEEHRREAGRARQGALDELSLRRWSARPDEGG